MTKTPEEKAAHARLAGQIMLDEILYRAAAYVAATDCRITVPHDCQVDFIDDHHTVLHIEMDIGRLY